MIQPTSRFFIANRLIKIGFATIVILLFTGRFVAAQVNDAGLWTSLCLEKKITPRFSLELTEELRFNENVTELGTFFTEAGESYKVTKWFKVSAYYRFTNKRQIDDYYSKRHQISLDLTFRKKFKPIIIAFRTKFKGEYRDINSSEYGRMPYIYSENKLTLKYDLRGKFQPYIFVETFTPIWRPEKTSRPQGVFLDQAKYCIGTDYTINRRHALNFYYLIQKEYNVNNPQCEFIGGIGYCYSF